MKLDQEFWNERWALGKTGWDIGHPSPALVESFSKIDKNASILIPGCGNAYEAEWLLQNGYTDVTLIDIAPKAVENLNDKFANESSIKIICGDYFLHQGQYDYIIEQTFFCAIDVTMRDLMVKKTSQLLKDQGIWTGLLFNKDFGNTFPPFGGSEEEYRSRFGPYFDIITMEISQNSIRPRQGSELFFEVRKK